MLTRLLEEELLETELLLLEGALLTLLLVDELRVETLFLLREGALLTALVRELLCGVLYVFVLRETERLVGVFVTVLLVTLLRFGERMAVERPVTVLPELDRTSALRTLLLSTLLDRSTAVLPATLPLVRFDLVVAFLLTPLLFLANSPLRVVLLLRSTVRLLRETFPRRALSSRTVTRLSLR